MNDYALDGLSRLLVESDCRSLVLKAASSVDNAKYAEFAALFTQGGTLRRPNGKSLVGSEEIIACYTSRPADRITRHLILESIFTHISQDAASAMTDVIVWSASLADEVGQFGRPARSQTIGRFVDDFVRTRAGWRINRRDASFDFFAG